MKKIVRIAIILAILFSMLGSIPPQPVQAAALLTVTNASNSGIGSLRQAIIDASDGDTINFASNLAGETIHLASELEVDKSITIDASALGSRITISGDTDNDDVGDVQIMGIGSNGVVKIINIDFVKGKNGDSLLAGGINNFGGSLELENCTFAGNIGDTGGAILNNGTLTIQNCVFQSNSATEGGAVYISGTAVITNSSFFQNSANNGGGFANYGDLLITNSAVTGNTAANGGGIFNNSSPYSLLITNCTIAGNEATSAGGGIHILGGTAHSINNTFSDNKSVNGGNIHVTSGSTFNSVNTILATTIQSQHNCSGDGTIDIGQGELTESENLATDNTCGLVAQVTIDDLKLSPVLADNGGPTQTIALQSGSIAIDAGNAVMCSNAPVSNVDQRGVARPQGSQCDIGAYEYQTPIDAFTNCAAQTEIPQLECEALVALYNSTNGANWTNNTGWLQTNTPCSWYMVSCNEGHVNGLNSYNNLLTGSIPSEIGNLTKLQWLDLEYNQLSGEFPNSIINLENLHWFSFDTCGGLTTSNPDVIGFLDGLVSGWSICPEDFVIEGKDHWVKNGSATVHGYNGTDFGNVVINSSHFNVFRIVNQIGYPLYLTGNPIVEIDGSSAFSVTSMPDDTITTEWWSIKEDFSILFNPQSAGIHTATVSIANSSASQNPYTFTIQGVAIWDDLYEKDDDFSTAKPISPAAPQTHALYPSSIDKDFVKFTLSSPSGITLETTGAWGYDTEIALYDENHVLQGYDNDGGEFLYAKLNKTCATPLPAGTYYAMVYNYEGVVPEYQLQLSVEDCPPTVSSIMRTDTSPASTSNVDFTVTFSEPVQDVDAGDFTLTTTGVTGAAITGVTGSGSTRTVTVNTGSGNGTIRLDVPDTATIKDLVNNDLAGIPFTSGESYSILKSPPKPVSAPLTSQPKRNSFINSPTPQFLWNEVANAVGYEIVIATDSAFSQVVLTESTTSASFTPINPLGDGKYFWRVRAFNSVALPGKFSVTQIFTVDTTPPAAPALTSPTDAATLRSYPVFTWSRVSGAVLYEYQYDNDADMSSPTYLVTTRNTSHRPPAMPRGTYFWRVRAQDASGNWSDWSLIFSISINR